VLSRDEKGAEFLMLACHQDQFSRVDFFLYPPGDKKLFDPKKPQFSSTYSPDKTDWRVVDHAERLCEECRYRRSSFFSRNITGLSCCCGDLPAVRRMKSTSSLGSCSPSSPQRKATKNVIAEFNNSRQKIGSGLCHCMDAQLSTVKQTSSHTVETPKIRRASSASLSSIETVQVRSKLPEWCPERNCLVIDFNNRDVLSSARNFQIRNDRDEVVLQFAKVGPRKFLLEFAHPFSPAHAFAGAMATLFWK